MTSKNDTNLELLEDIRTMNLGEAIDALRGIQNRVKADAWVTFSDGAFVPGKLVSDRGSYADLAIVRDHWDGGKTTVEMLIDRLEAAVGETFHGWKGGDYVMDRGSNLRVTYAWGESGYHKIIAFETRGDYAVHIHTRYEDY